MSLAFGGDPPWGLVEWAATAVTSTVLAAGAFLWRLAFRLDSACGAIERQRSEIVEVKQAGEVAAQRLAERFLEHHDDHCRLREAVAGLPTRADLRDMEERLGERIEALAARLDHAVDSRSG
jgi:hypothetical protein